MRLSWWVVIAVAGALVGGGAVAFLGTLSESVGTTASQTRPGSDQTALVVPVAQREAQNRPPAAPARPQAPQGQQIPQAPQAPQAQQGPRRIETTEYDSWVVTCDNTTTIPKCFAVLRVLNRNREVVLNWEIGLDPQGRWIAAIHVPPGLTVRDGDKTLASPPIMIANGVDLKFGNAAARRLSYVSCGLQQCVAEAIIDDTFVRDALANANGNASIIVYTNGGNIPFNVSIKGIDKAIASTRK